MGLMRLDSRRKCYQKFGARVLGRYSTASAVSAAGITDAAVINSVIENVAQWQHWHMHRPNQAGHNRNKLATLITSATLQHGESSNYDTSTFSDYSWELLPPDIHPDDDLNAALSEAQRLLFFETDGPATIWANGRFDSPDVDDFAATAASGLLIEPTEVSTYNETGFRSMLLTWSAGGVYCRPAEAVYVNEGDVVSIYAAIMPVSGISAAAPVTFDVWDESTGARLAGTTQITVGVRGPRLIGGAYTIPDGVDAIGFRLGAPSGAIVAVDNFPGHNHSEQRQPLPSYVDAPYKLLSVATGRYERQLAGNAWAARSRVLDSWKASQDYIPEGLRAEGIDPRVRVRRAMPNEPIWFSCLRPWYDKVPFTSDTQETGASDELELAACYATVGTMLAIKRNSHAFDGVILEAKALLNTQFASEIAVEEPEERSILIPGGRAGRYSQG